MCSIVLPRTTTTAPDPYLDAPNPCHQATRLGLLLPLLPARQQVVVDGQRKVNVHGGAARQRSGVATAYGRGREGIQATHTRKPSREEDIARECEP